MGRPTVRGLSAEAVRARRGRGRVLLFALWAGIVLTLGGCVYQRLLRFGAQCQDFDRAFAVVWTDRTYTVTFREPVLRADDLRWMGFPPTRVEPSPGPGAAEVWTWSFVSDSARAVEFTGRFERGRLAELSLPVEVAGVLLPPPVLRRLAHLVGFSSAQVAQRRVVTRGDVPMADPAAVLPNLPQVAQAFGLPLPAGADDELRWEYRLVTSEAERTFFRFRFAPGPDSSFGRLEVTWSEAILIWEPDRIELWQPSARRRHLAETARDRREEPVAPGPP